ncbi:Cof-type HAD-IIB family hydrolase [Effusibacillus pohliae]|uniref:Cof-type HAD-IIB family hydrolase n=1 Tax=Effusibacillus pohliae TaxID=232270 RepID=UPI00036C33AF|nr:Cof-type HAD-IIB family hydrolase [Effusibacillus pohliae]
MRRRLVAIDLDGTALTNEKKILPSTKQIIQQVRERGHEVVIATGRPPRSSVHYHCELDLTAPMVNFNGALIHDPVRPERDIHFPLDREVVLQIVEECKRFAVENVMVEVKDAYYVQQVDDFMELLADGVPPRGVGPIEAYLLEHPTSVLIRTSPEKIEPLRETLNRTYSRLVAHRYWSTPYHVIEVVKAGVSKATGLKILADTFGFEREDVIAFGDEENDIEMIRWAGVGVAMGNADSRLKELADCITESNENDGIAILLKKLLL